MSYWLHRQAAMELGDAADYYERNASRKIANMFIEEFERVIGLLQRNQQLGTPREAGMRIYPFRKFPYSVVYREEEEKGPRVYAIAHQRRDSNYWQARV